MASAGQENGKSSGKLRNLADSGSLLDPVNVTENEVAMVKDNQKQISQAEILQELEMLDTLQDKQIRIFSCDNAQLFFIEPEGYVKTTNERYKLIIFRIQGLVTDTVFLRVGTWVYPLWSELSPCYRSSEGIYIFPDPYSNEVGATVGLLLPSAERDALHVVLTQLLSQPEGDRTRRSIVGDAAVAISENVNRGTSYLSRSLVRASESLAGYMDVATPLTLTNLQPQEKYISPEIEKSARIAAAVSGNAARATNYLSGGLWHAVTTLGKYVSPYVNNLVMDTVPPNVVQVTANTFRGVNNIYDGLAQSAVILSRSVSNNAVKIVEHKYGQHVGHVTSDILSTIGNIYAVKRNVSVWKPKSVAKAAVKGIGQAIVEDRREYLRQQNQQSSKSE